MLHEATGTACLHQLRFHLFPAVPPSLTWSLSDASVSSARLRFSSSAPDIQPDQVATFARQITGVLLLVFLLRSLPHVSARIAHPNALDRISDRNGHLPPPSLQGPQPGHIVGSSLLGQSRVERVGSL
jgi:hypothetical protein